MGNIVPGRKLILLLLLLLPLLLYKVVAGAQVSGDKRHVSNCRRGNRTAAAAVRLSRVKKAQTSGCNLFQGRWVSDPSYPLYYSATCPFIDGEFDCLKFGRPDRQFLKYSWQPASCILPRFDGKEFLRRMRGKRVMFVGDSLSQNMWESLGCMIHASVPNAKTTFIKRTPLSSIAFQDYGVILYMYRTLYLVDISKEKVGRILNLETIDDGANAWKSMDVLVFNSWHWWTHRGRSQGWDYIRYGSSLLKDMNRMEAFYRGLTTWARWVDLNVDTSKTRVFFQGISPTHYEGREWNEPKMSCSGQNEPYIGSTYPGGAPPATAVVAKVLTAMRKPVYLLDITRLSQLRKDAHPSTYGSDGGTDCSHWCLPGLPDTWNQLLFAALSM